MVRRQKKKHLKLHQCEVPVLLVILPIDSKTKLVYGAPYGTLNSPLFVFVFFSFGSVSFLFFVFVLFRSAPFCSILLRFFPHVPVDVSSEAFRCADHSVPLARCPAIIAYIVGVRRLLSFHFSRIDL